MKLTRNLAWGDTIADIHRRAMSTEPADRETVFQTVKEVLTEDGKELAGTMKNQFTSTFSVEQWNDFVFTGELSGLNVIN